MARPTKLDDLISKKIGDALASGNTRTTAARLAGIHPETLRAWVTKGEAGDPTYSAFAVLVDQKEAEAEAESLKVVRDAARSGTWQAAAWFLERRAPESWGRGVDRPGDLDGTAGAGGLLGMTPDELVRFYRGVVEDLASVAETGRVSPPPEGGANGAT